MQQVSITFYTKPEKFTELWTSRKLSNTIICKPRKNELTWNVEWLTYIFQDLTWQIPQESELNRAREKYITALQAVLYKLTSCINCLRR